MTIFRFRIYWEDDDQTYRDIEIEGHQTFLDFHNCIVRSFEFDGKHSASFFVSTDKWDYGMEINSEVLVNKKGAPSLSMLKTPVSALIALPDQKFVYTYHTTNKFVFHVELINISKDVVSKRTYPFLLRSEGIAPSQYGIKGINRDKIVEIEEKYDVGGADMSDGFGDEGDVDSDSESETGENEVMGEDDNQSFDI